MMIKVDYIYSVKIVIELNILKSLTYIKGIEKSNLLITLYNTIVIFTLKVFINIV